MPDTNPISRGAATQLDRFWENRVPRHAKWRKRITCCGRCIVQLRQWIAFQPEDKLVSIVAFPVGWHYQIFLARSSLSLSLTWSYVLTVYRPVEIETNNAPIEEILRRNVDVSTCIVFSSRFASIRYRFDLRGCCWISRVYRKNSFSYLSNFEFSFLLIKSRGNWFQRSCDD